MAKEMKCWECGDILAIPICRECAKKEFAPEIERLRRIVGSVVDEADRIEGPPEPVYEIQVEIERLTEIVEKLPKTADGVPVAPGMTLYRVPGNNGYISGEQCGFVVFGVTNIQAITAYNDAETVATSDCFSTHEAAEAAKENGQ